MVYRKKDGYALRRGVHISPLLGLAPLLEVAANGNWELTSIERRNVSDCPLLTLEIYLYGLKLVTTCGVE
ncbi:hypothetical protein DY000_02040024 [Brassica cretica]|uniref:Uncharacterized protein n=1 Tax=Brassica cretica TaxID=69181 RepID=A0ABQ7B6V3_BRACR|nr:hypothetical protein DY000_02040024 [Brassica cretica]